MSSGGQSSSGRAWARPIVILIAALVVAATVVGAPAVPGVAETGTAHAAETEQRAAVSIGGNCAVADDGTAWCWGEMWDGALGNGTGGFSSYRDDNSPVPVQVNGLSDVAAVSDDCALSATGAVSCWGDKGQVEDGTASLFYPEGGTAWGSLVPVTKAAGGVAQISGKCARFDDGTVQCFGYNHQGQLGNGTGGYYTTWPTVYIPQSVGYTPVSGISTAVDVSFSGSHGCAVLADGRVQCWGVNEYGQLGNGESGYVTDSHGYFALNSTPPVFVAGLDDVERVFAGSNGTCAVESDGTAWCWGSNVYSRFASTPNPTVLPTRAPAFDAAVSIAMNRGNACAVLDTGAVVCRGNDTLGDGLGYQGDPAFRDVTFPDVLGVEVVDNGGYGYCLRDNEGAVRCWGYNSRGDTGTGTATDTPLLVPTPVVGFGGVVPISAELQVEVTATPGKFDLEQDPDGQPVPKVVDVSVAITNTNELAIEPVSAPETLITGVLVGEQKLISQTRDALPSATVGKIAKDQTKTVTYQLTVDGDGIYEVKALVLFADPVDGSSQASVGTAQIRVGYPSVLNADVKFVGAEGDPPNDKTVDAGDSATVFVGLENVSNTQTVTIDSTRLSYVGGALATPLYDSTEPVPPKPAPGQCPFPQTWTLGPGDHLLLEARVFTAPEHGTRTVFTYAPTGTVTDPSAAPAEAERDLVSSDVEFADNRRILTLHVNDPGVNYGETSWGAAVGAFTIGFIEGSSEFLYSNAVGMLELAKAAVNGLAPMNMVKTMQYAGTAAGTISAMSPSEIAAWIERTAVKVADAEEKTVDAVKAEFESHMTKVLTAYYTGDTLGFAKLMGGDTATLAWNVGLCEMAAGKVVKAVAETKAAVQLTRLTRAGLETIITGTEIAPRAAKAFGYGREMVDDLARFAERNNLNITIKPRDPEALTRIKNRLAKMKPEFIKIKNVTDIDIDVLGFPASSKATVAVRPELAEEISDISALRRRFNDARAANPGKYSEDMFAAVEKRWRKRVAELDDYMPQLRELDGTSFTREFNTVDNGIAEGIGVKTHEKFDIVDIGNGTVEMRLDGYPVTSDVDILSIVQANGRPLSRQQRIQVYEHLAEIADIQHPESATWIKYGDAGDSVADFNAKQGIFDDYKNTAKPSNDPALQFGADGKLRGVRYSKATSYFTDAENYYVDWAGGARSAGLAPVQISGDVSGYTSLTSRVFEAGGIVLAGGYVRSRADGSTQSSQQSNDPDAQSYRGNADGSVDRYQSPATAASHSLSSLGAAALGAAGGTWVPVPAAVLDSLGVIKVLPQTETTEPSAAGATTLKVFSRSDLTTVASTGKPLLDIAGYFTKGQAIVVDPGGEHEELATVASVEPFRLTAPLKHAHDPGEMVIAVRLAGGGGGTTTGSDDIVTVSPARLLDTRIGESTIDGRQRAIGRRRAGSVTELEVLGRGGVPSDATAVVVNIAAIRPSQRGFVTVFPCGTKVPTASTLNVAAGEVRANGAIAKIPTGGKVCLYTHRDMDLLVDVTGYVPAASSVITLPPARVLETRAGQPTVDGTSRAIGRRSAGSITKLDVRGRGGVPASAAAVLLNVTAVNPSATGYVTVFPCGVAKPQASSLNVPAGGVVANSAIAKLGSGGQFCLYTNQEMDLVVDVTGWIPAASGVATLAPARLLETRPGEPTLDDRQRGIGRRSAGQVTQVDVTGRGGVGAGASSVVVNVTAIRPEVTGYVTVYPCGIDRPTASSLNIAGGAVVANSVVTSLGSGGKVCIFTQRAMDLAVDVTASVS